MSELAGKEIVNLLTGERLGLVGESDLVLDEAGQVSELQLPGRRGLLGTRAPAVVPWSSIRRVGPEVVIVEIAPPAGDGRPR